MAIQLDHILVPSSNRNAAARQLAEILGVEWGPARIGPFSAVYVSDSLTIDFDEWQQDFPQGHYCFRVTDAEFEAILGRLKAAGIGYRSMPHGPEDGSVNTSLGSKILYWSQPGGHIWELLTVSYARRES
jgi:hypothetical protein